MKTNTYKTSSMMAIAFMALSLISSENLKAVRGNEDLDLNLTQGKFLIKNTKHDEFLYTADQDRMSGDRVVQGSKGIFPKSIFTFEKRPEGYVIKSVKHGEYLYVADSDRIGGDRAVESNKKIMSKSYFTVLQDPNGYILKNNKHSEYLLLSNSNRISGDRVVKSWGILDNNSYFDFIEYDQDWFE